MKNMDCFKKLTIIDCGATLCNNSHPARAGRLLLMYLLHPFKHRDPVQGNLYLDGFATFVSFTIIAFPGASG